MFPIVGKHFTANVVWYTQDGEQFVLVSDLCRTGVWSVYLSEPQISPGIRREKGLDGGSHDCDD